MDWKSEISCSHLCCYDKTIQGSNLFPALLKMPNTKLIAFRNRLHPVKNHGNLLIHQNITVAKAKKIASVFVLSALIIFLLQDVKE
ncbi:MAG: hypothetical protein DYG84_12385 [Candidatus Brocadia sp. AMX3]|nr:hypothetical protein [Candidatus Brocadia sp. AMX3]